MRVLFLAPQPFHEVRGTPLAVEALVRALAGLGHEIDLLTFPQGDPWTPPPQVRHLRTARLAGDRVRPGFSFGKLAQDVPFAAEAIGLARSGAYDVVHAVEEAALLVAPFVPSGVRFVVDMDSDLGEQLSSTKSSIARALGPAARSLHARALRRADLALVINESLARAARESRPDLDVRILADPPLLTRLTAADEAAGRALRSELRLGEARVVLYTGNFEPYQGVELLKQASAAVDAAFVFVGGAAGDVARLSRDAPASCRFVGPKAPSSLGAWMSLADVLVSPRSRGGNTPFKIYTYMASGKPIVATRLDTHTQVLSDETAFLVEPTAAAIAEGVRAALSDPIPAAARARAAQDLLRREYSQERHAERVAAAYASLTSVR